MKEKLSNMGMNDSFYEKIMSIESDKLESKNKSDSEVEEMMRATAITLDELDELQKIMDEVDKK